MPQAILFAKCLGLNDARNVATLKANPRTGATELSDCLNITTTPDGCVEKIAPFVTALTHTAPVTGISAGQRFLFQDSINTNEWTGTAVINRFPVVDGPIVHTAIDCRVSTPTTVYKSVNASPAMQQAIVGTNPNPAASRTFTAMPPYRQAFTYNGIIYAVNKTDPRFLQYSENYHFDLWDIGSGFIGHTLPVLQTGSILSGQPGIPGCIVATHTGGVSVYAGTSKADFVKKFYPCQIINGTLYSGFIDKANEYGHLFLCNDGVYLIAADGTLTNLTGEATGHMETLNTAYTCATVQDGKYLAFGNSICVEYDFQTKTVLKRASFDVKAATIWQNKNYYALGSTVAAMGTEIDSSDSFSASLTLPLSDYGASGTKSIEALYFTGQGGDNLKITASDNAGKSWEIEEHDVGTVTDYRIKTPKGFLGNHISIKIDCLSGSFRMEELRAAFSATKRSR